MILLLSFLAVIVYLWNTPIDLDEEQGYVISVLFKIYLIASISSILISEISGNYSQVDKLWSVLPIIYSWVVSYYDGFEYRTLICAVLITLWGLRLSYNFAKKGGYSWIPWKGEEDYRWDILKKRTALGNRYLWSLFNIFFISFYQLGLILYFTIPVVLCMNTGDDPWNWIDILALSLFIIFFIIEAIADKQQFEFQTEKYKLIHSGQELSGVYKKGFIDSGLWGIVRHPNYLGEQMMWFAIYLFGVAATGEWINWTIGGILLLILLFRGSSDFSESISSEKYPDYKDYIRSVGRFFPKL